jgi:transposase
LRLAGLSYAAITKRTGRSKGKIYDWSVKYACVLDPDRVPDGDGLPEGWLHLAAGLPERHRQAVVERSGGATWVQVAERLGCSKSNARTLYDSGVRALWAAHRNQTARAGAGVAA